MKHARKLASLLLALIMVFALATTAFAAENTTISAPKGSTEPMMFTRFSPATSTTASCPT